MSKRIKTYLKFQRSERDKVAFVSYVRKENGSWKGCHESDGCKKKIVLADAGVAETLLENVLYNKLENRRSIDGIIQTLARRIDIKDQEQVIADFRESAEIVLAYWKADHPSV